MNLPFFHLKILTKMAKNVQSQPENKETSLFHIGLRKILVEEELRKKNHTWNHFLFLGGFEKNPSENLVA